MGFYDKARLYDEAFAWRDTEAECTFMLECARHLGRSVGSCLELASGPSRCSSRFPEDGGLVFGHYAGDIA